MRKFSLQVLGLFIILFALRLMAERAPALYVLRDGGLLALAGSVLFAANALSLWRPPPPNVLYHWSIPGQTLFVAGCLTALTGGLLYLRPGSDGAMGLAMQTTLWFLGMGMMMAGAAWHGSVRTYRSPSHRWQLDEAGVPIRLPRQVDAPSDNGRTAPLALSRYAVISLALLIILLGATLRMWHLLTLPPACVNAECIMGLRLLDPALPLLEHNPLDPFGWVARALFSITNNSLLSLRLAGAAIGIITLPVFFAAATQVSDAGGALLATLLLSLNPWHIAAGRSAESWLVVVLLLSFALWATLRALHDHRRGWWVLAGLATGGMALAAPPLRPAIWLLALWVIALGFLHMGENRRSRYGGLAIYAAAVCVASLPTVLPLPGLAFAEAGIGAQASALLDALFRGEPAWPALRAVGWGVTALALAGAGALVRWWRRATAGVLLGALFLFGAALLLFGEAKIATGGALLSLLPILLLCAAVALDQLVRTFGYAWDGVIRPVATVAGALVLVGLLSVRPLFALNSTLADQATAGEDPGLSAMVGYLLDRADAEDAPYVLAPAALFDLPAARLSAGALLDGPDVAPLGDPFDILLTDTSGRNLQLLLAAAQHEVRDLLNQFYPGSQAEPIFDDDGRLLFNAVTVPADTLRLRQGLAGTYYRGDPATELIADQRDGPLAFDWSSPPELAAPFRVDWSGSLLVPATGDYRFAVSGVDDPAALFSLQLDDEIVLDSSLGLLEIEKTLARGPYRLTMRYATGVTGDNQPPPLIVTWTPPGGAETPIPRNALISPALPEMGLLGMYFADPDFAGPALTMRKELIVGAPDSNQPQGAAVRWQGNLAASRSGEYLLAVVADGDYELTIDGLSLIDSRLVAPGEDPTTTRGYTESLIYLEQGWHELTLRFVPAEPGAELRLLWQPPGGAPDVIPPIYLSPHPGALETTDLPLPPPPPLTDPGLGDDRFALSQSTAQRAPQQIILPQNLPQLPLTPAWQTSAGCGSDPAQLAAPHGVTIDAAAGRIYVADTGNQRIVAYTFDGEPVAFYADERLTELSDVALDPTGAPLALDAGSQLVYRIDLANGTAEALTVRTGFYRPRGLDADWAGALYVADTGGGRVVIVDSDGSVAGEFGGPDSALGAGQPVDALATGQALWAVTSEDGRLTNLYTGGSQSAVARAVSIDGPHLAGLEDDSFFVSDPVRRIIVRFSAQGQPLQELAYSDRFVLPTGIATALVDDQLYMAVVDTQQCSLSLWNGPAELLSE